MPTFTPTYSVPPPSIWMSGREISKQIVKVKTLSNDGITYGPIIRFDMGQPDDRFTIEFSHITDPNFVTWITALCQMGATMQITDDMGKEWIGLVSALSCATFRGTQFYTNVRVSLESVTVTDN